MDTTATVGGVPLVAAAVCPHPPLLVPDLASGAASELDDLRAACDAALTALLGSDVSCLVVIGSDDPQRPQSAPVTPHPAPAATRSAVQGGPVVASFARFGVPVTVRLDRAEAPQPLPLSLSVAAWLLRDVSGPRILMRSVPADAPAAWCAALDPSPSAEERWALLVMGDGSACRGVSAPGYDDPRAEAFDAAVAAALRDVDTKALLDLDPTLAAELRCAGRAPWQVLAGVVARDGRAWRGMLHYEAAPYGVAYFVASWTPLS